MQRLSRVAHACIHPFAHVFFASCIHLPVGFLHLFPRSSSNTCSRLMGQQIKQSAAGIAWPPRKSQPLHLPAPVSPLSLAPTANCLALPTHLRTLLHLLELQKQKRTKRTTFPGMHKKRNMIRPHHMSWYHLIMHNAQCCTTKCGAVLHPMSTDLMHLFCDCAASSRKSHVANN